MGSQNPSISERIKGADGTGNMTTDSNDADEQKKQKEFKCCLCTLSASSITLFPTFTFLTGHNTFFVGCENLRQSKINNFTLKQLHVKLPVLFLPLVLLMNME